MSTTIVPAVAKEKAVAIIPWSKARIAKPVEFYVQIKTRARALREFANGTFKNQSCIALHDAQCAEDPYNFSVLSEIGMKAAEFQLPWLIMNPRMISYGEAREMDFEGCMSFPFRQAKKIQRYTYILVEYDTVEGGFFGKKMIHVRKELAGFAAKVFQHEYDHSKHKTIYD